jgi:hypothetical protein
MHTRIPKSIFETSKAALCGVGCKSNDRESSIVQRGS